MARYFTGFSTVDNDQSRDWTLYDIDLVNRDLYNHFHTRIGERVMRPTWGCRIWDWLMEPLTSMLRDQIAEEAISICNSDSRVSVIDVRVDEIEHGVKVSITMQYAPEGIVDTFAIDFEQREQTSFQ